MSENNLPIQPTANMGIVGHVDHGKTTLTKLLSGKWTDTHSEEKKRGITIKLGYTNFTIWNKDDDYSVKTKEGFKAIKKISIVDAPGHESFMATMISGAAIMDYALLVVAANEKCPQPQTIEHIKTLEISGIKNIIVIQNKIDLVTKEEAIENFNQINKFLNITIYGGSSIIPMSAQHSSNVSVLLEYISKEFVSIKSSNNSSSNNPLMYVIRSFDINKPGDTYDKLKGGVIGGSIKEGEFNVGDEIEIKPGVGTTKDGKVNYTSVNAKITSINSDKDSLQSARSGGSIAIMTKLDPTITKTDSLVGQIIGKKGTLPDPISQFKFEIHLFDKIVTSAGELEVKPIILSEPLMLIVNSYTTVGAVIKANPKEATVKIKRPVMAFDDDRVVIFRRFDQNKWRIIGYGIIKK